MTFSRLMHQEVFYPNFLRDKKHDSREPGPFKEEFTCFEVLCLSSNTCCCYHTASNKLKISSKGLNKCIVEQNRDGPVQKSRKFLDDSLSIESTNRDFTSKDHTVARYEQTKRGLSYVCPKEKCRTMEITNIN